MFAENSSHTLSALFPPQRHTSSLSSECTLQPRKTPSQLLSFPIFSKRVRNSLIPLMINSLYFATHAHSLSASPAFSMISQKQTCIYSRSLYPLAAPIVEKCAKPSAISVLAATIPNPPLLPKCERNFALATSLCILC
jgi:hypothetical protein